MMHYPAKLSPNGTGGYLVQFGDVPEALTEGNSIEAALDNAVDALDTALLGRMKDGEGIPSPSTLSDEGIYLLSPSAQAAAKLAFYEAFRQSGITRTALARKIGKDEAEVRRMLDPHHATKLSALDGAIRAMGQRLTLVLEPA